MKQAIETSPPAKPLPKTMDEAADRVVFGPPSKLDRIATALSLLALGKARIIYSKTDDERLFLEIAPTFFKDGWMHILLPNGKSKRILLSRKMHRYYRKADKHGAFQSFQPVDISDIPSIYWHERDELLTAWAALHGGTPEDDAPTKIRNKYFKLKHTE